jgi:hypothetical protein
VRATLLALSALIGVCWGFEKSATIRLQAQLKELRDQEAELNNLHKARDLLTRIASQAPQSSRSAGAVAPTNAARPADSGETPAGSMKPGTWAPAGGWKNCGRATPESAIETVLWAASGGDLDTLKASLFIGDEARSKAESVLANLPDGLRHQFATPEDLLALIVAGNIPLDSALLAARQQNGTNDVTEYLRLKDAQGRSRQVFLSLRNGPDGWRLSVPANALEPIARVEGNPANP